METWGFCGGCDRWFYCGRGEGQATVCPVCGSAAEVTEQRAAAE